MVRRKRGIVLKRKRRKRQRGGALFRRKPRLVDKRAKGATMFFRSTRRTRSTENPLDWLQLRWLGNIGIRSFTGWDFRSASG